jgi:hypothetical protein
MHQYLQIVRPDKEKSMDDDAYRYQRFVFGGTFIFHPFTQATDSNTSRLAYTSVGISEASLYHRPHVFHDGYHVFTATFDRHAEGEDCATAEVGIGGLKILLYKGPKKGKYLCRGESRCQNIDYSQRRLKN